MSHQHVIADTNHAHWRVEMARVMEDQSGGVATNAAGIASFDNFTQTPAIHTWRKRRDTFRQIVQCWQQIPLYDRDVTLRSGFDSRTGYHERDT